MEEKEKDDDIIYIYEEKPEESILDDSGPNFSQAENADSNICTHEEDYKSKGSVFGLLLKILLNPVEGWKSVRRSKITLEEIQSRLFYPLIAILSLSQFVELFYSSRISLTVAVEDAVKAFVSFFFGYFCIVMILKIIMPSSAVKKIDSEFGKIFITFNLSTLCIFFAITELLPMLWAILIFLPLWTVYSICRGARFFQFPDKMQIRCTALLCLTIVGFPLLLDWILDKFLPSI